MRHVATVETTGFVNNWMYHLYYTTGVYDVVIPCMTIIIMVSLSLSVIKTDVNWHLDDLWALCEIVTVYTVMLL